MEHLIKLALAQSTSTIGTVTRTWLRVMGLVSVPWFLMCFHDLRPVHGAVEAAIRAFPASIIVGGLVSVLVMPVLMILHVARKW